MSTLIVKIMGNFHFINKDYYVISNQLSSLKILKYSLFSLLWFIPCFGQSSPQDLLNHLQGNWDMTGTIKEKPVKYTAEGVWGPQNQYLFLKMKDVVIPPKYDENLFIVIDSSKNQYVASWIDKLSGVATLGVGQGPLSSVKIEIMYTYSEQDFRKIFIYDSRKDEWTLVIESLSTDSNWSVYAKYSLVRKQ